MNDTAWFLVTRVAACGSSLPRPPEGFSTSPYTNTSTASSHHQAIINSMSSLTGMFSSSSATPATRALPTSPTAEMPIPCTPLQLEMLRVLEMKALISKLCQKLPDLSSAQSEKAHIRMVELLYNMDNGAIRAIMAGTVAYDTFNGHAAWPKTPTRKHGGKYGVLVIGLSRPGGRGEFLNIKETEALVHGLKRYIEGVRLRNTFCTAPAYFHPLEALGDRLDWVHTVDTLIGSATANGVVPSSPFIQTESEILSIEQVISMFKKRCNRAVDLDDEVHQIQSPLYVTCSDQLQLHMHDRPSPASRAQFLEHKPLGIVMGVLEALNIPIELSIQVALYPISIWACISRAHRYQLEQLFPAEQLISALACSLVDQHGLNTFKIEPPVSSPVPIDLEALEHTPATHEAALQHTIALIREHCGARRRESDDLNALGVVAHTVKDLHLYLSDDGPREEHRQRLATDEEELKLHQQLLQGNGGDNKLLLETLAIFHQSILVVPRSTPQAASVSPRRTLVPRVRTYVAAADPPQLPRTALQLKIPSGSRSNPAQDHPQIQQLPHGAPCMPCRSHSQMASKSEDSTVFLLACLTTSFAPAFGPGHASASLCATCRMTTPWRRLSLENDSAWQNDANKLFTTEREHFGRLPRSSWIPAAEKVAQGLYLDHRDNLKDQCCHAALLDIDGKRRVGAPEWKKMPRFPRCICNNNGLVQVHLGQHNIPVSRQAFGHDKTRQQLEQLVFVFASLLLGSSPGTLITELFQSLPLLFQLASLFLDLPPAVFKLRLLLSGLSTLLSAVLSQAFPSPP
ncbi:hypothetical protein NM208_g14342 [Fusarium decemcellulare]|uniref:Uncharacterized protein n=1 Tax=Fusarium decemcellulare TaxID=57161 RepID=A0ACC1RHW0_9HYPO|nr:hypothetical protein NM208_g14342 [Fusarium decemcellulare]